jgi:hypothetical protein
MGMACKWVTEAMSRELLSIALIEKYKLLTMTMLAQWPEVGTVAYGREKSGKAYRLAPNSDGGVSSGRPSAAAITALPAGVDYADGSDGRLQSSLLDRPATVSKASAQH